MEADPTELTFMDVLRRYRDVFLMLPRAVKWYWAARGKTKVVVSVALLLCALAIAAGIVLRQKAPWREALTRRVIEPLRGAHRAGNVSHALTGPAAKDPLLERSIAAGVSNRIVYVDSHHGASPASLLALMDIGVKAFVFTGDLVSERAELFRAGAMVMVYEQHKPELTDEEYAVVRSYIANGGRVMLLCPAWVWVAYEKKPLDRLPYNQIAAEYGVALGQECVPGPLTVAHDYFGTGRFGADPRTAFSVVRGSSGLPILTGSNGQAAAWAATRGTSRMVVWGANNLLGGKVVDTPEGRKIAEQAFNWLLDDRVILKARPSSAAESTPEGAGASRLDAAAVARLIASGVGARSVYIDGYHAVAPSNLEPFQRAELHPSVHSDAGFIKNRDQLFNSGLLVMMYGRNRPDLTSAEYGILKQYVENGGRLLLMCPAWVWDAYEHRPLSELPYDWVARQFGLGLEVTYAKPPLKASHSVWTFGGLFGKTSDVFSTITYTPGAATPILTGADGKPTAVAVTKGNGRLILWGHDNLLAAKTVADPMARDDVVRMLRWLME